MLVLLCEYFVMLTREMALVEIKFDVFSLLLK